MQKCKHELKFCRNSTGNSPLEIIFTTKDHFIHASNAMLQSFRRVAIIKNQFTLIVNLILLLKSPFECFGSYMCFFALILKNFLKGKFTFNL